MEAAYELRKQGKNKYILQYNKMERLEKRIDRLERKLKAINKVIKEIESEYLHEERRTIVNNLIKLKLKHTQIVLESIIRNEI